VAASGRFTAVERVVVPWTRRVTVEVWMTDQASHSYVAALDAPDRSRLLARLDALARDRFPTGAMEVPYETWVWTGRRLPGAAGAAPAGG
jgi:hypothetical protein